MTMNSVFNSVFENSLRMVLLCNVYAVPVSLDMLHAVDFIVIYGKDFGISDNNLNGENPYKYSEYPAKRALIQEALKELVLNGLVFPVQTLHGLNYQITPAGKKYADSLGSEYAKEYKKIATDAVSVLSQKSEREIIDSINKLSSNSIKRGAMR